MSGDDDKENDGVTEASEEDTQKEMSRGADTDDADVDFHPFSEVQESVELTAIQKVTAADGMPTQVSLAENSDIPPLTLQSLVCLEDTSTFVLRDSVGRIRQSFEPEQVEQMPNGYWYVDAEHIKAGLIDEKLRAKGKLIAVEPIRPRCQHYVEQSTSFELNAHALVHLRLCSGRRSNGGAFMSVRDTGIYACSMRSPRDLGSEKRLQEFNEKKIEEGLERLDDSIFSGKGK